MRRHIWNQLRYRPRRALTLGLATLIAAIGFTLLTASASTSALQVHGTLTSSFRPAYDILVRPRRTETKLERSEGLVRPNFLSGVYGGISFRQWHEIKRIRGVSVAAPIANVGYVLLFSTVAVPIRGLTASASHQLYRIRESWVADDGLSRIPGPDAYVYYTPRDRFVLPNRFSPWLEVGPATKRPEPSCSGFQAQPVPASPFPPLASQASIDCFPTSVSHGAFGPSANAGNNLPRARGFVGTDVSLYFPVYISAIDPVQEAKLIGLNKTVVTGRYLGEDEGFSHFRLKGTSSPIDYDLVPVLASSRTYVDEHLQLTIERLRIPKGTDVPRALASGTCLEAVVPCPKVLGAPTGASYRTAAQFVSQLHGMLVGRRTVTAAAAYRSLLTTPSLQGWPAGSFGPNAYWTTSPVRYRRLSHDRLAPLPTSNPWSIWRDDAYQGGYFEPPRDNLDTQFRTLEPRAANNTIVAGRAQWNPLKVVGEFDPTKLPSYSPLTRVPLETYYPPELEPADAAARAALHGRALLPDQNVGGYIQQPPLFLTTMQGLRAFLNPHHWVAANASPGSVGPGSSIPAAQRRAPISAIRVKVAGVTGPNPLSLERIKVVAQQIHTETGLAVDITAGSSPHPMTISLPKGRFGRPKLLLREGWSKKGVTVSFLRALDRKDLALFALILLICAFFLGNGALAAVRTRRAEIGTLLTLGWTRTAIFRAVLGELTAVGVIAGATGTGLAALLVEAFSLRLPLLRVLLVLPIAALLAVAAGTIPAWLAARGLPLDALRPPITARRRGRPVGSLTSLALVNLTRLPTRTLLGASGLTIGVAALAILIGIEDAFQGTLVGTILGTAVSLQVRSADFVAVALTLGLAGLSVADVVYLNLRERQAELVTLRTLGWTNRHLHTTVLLESLGLGLLGSLGGFVLALLVGGLVLSLPLATLAIAALAAAAAGTAAALTTSLLPLSQIGRLTVPAVLAAE